MNRRQAKRKACAIVAQMLEERKDEGALNMISRVEGNSKNDNDRLWDAFEDLIEELRNRAGIT